MKKSRSSRHFFGLPLSFLIPAGLFSESGNIQGLGLNSEGSRWNKPTSSEREARFSSRNLARQIERQSGVPAHALLLPPLPLLSPYTDTYIPAIIHLECISQMEPPVFSFDNLQVRNPDGNDADTEGFKHSVDGIFQKVDKLERRVNEVEQFYLNISKKQQSGSSKGGGSSIVKDKDKERHVPSIRKQQQDASKREAAAAKRMQELMRQLGTTLRQIAQHKWAWPFMQPVDVKGLGLHDYYEVIDKPMDLSTIKNQMEANDGTGYKNVREICADARTLLGKFEEKWLQLLPKVTEEEKRREDEEVEAKLDMQLAQEAAMARDLSNELYEVDMHLAELRNIVVQKCRKMSSEEKRKLGVALTRLSPEDLTKALEIVAQNNPGFQATAEEVDLDIDAQAESTLWRLKFFL
ncbi:TRANSCRIPTION FACTOR GTE6-RELATED [Salix koriyanagi]|uniref:TRANSCRIPTION FACTOR GTE6-RELATED n=1 Tax=Salix koriyanagi TaxID=2511006 RepID=A0A9Q0WTT2_9ROSI|nr:TRANSCRIPTION FACTOR GTE6-RELATED [Salix koriyanagi]